MVADLSIFIIPLAIYFLVDVISQMKSKYFKKNIIRLFGIYIILNTLMSFYHHPYLSPYEQKSKKLERLDERHKEIVDIL